VAGAVLAGVLTASDAPVAAAQRPALSYDAPITRTQVMIRAIDWLRRDIAYSQSNHEARWDRQRGRRYRPDCSGFVSMAWALDPRRPGLGRAPVTWELPRYSRVVSWARIRRGDIFLHLVPGDRSREHVRLFAGWADAARTRAWVIEQSSTAQGMQRRTVAVAAMRGGYRPYRYLKIR
jgi:hypothetical protein